MSDPARWEILDGGFDDPTSIPSLLDFLRAIAERDRLGIITVDWEGCPACVGGSSIYINTIRDFPLRYSQLFPNANIHYGTLHWRQAFDASDPSAPPSFKNVVEQSYKLFLWLTANRRQVYGGQRFVESFTEIPNYLRPKFPQLFFLDGFHIGVDQIDALIGLHNDAKLFHPYQTVDPQGNLLECHSGDLRFTDAAASSAVIAALGPGTNRSNALLLQLTNFNMYSKPGDANADFARELFLQSCDLAVEQFVTRPMNPANCVRYERRRDL